MKIKLLLASICVVLCGMLVPFYSVSAEELEEKTAYLTDEEFRDVIEEQISNLVSTRAVSYSLDWRVPGKTRYTTGYFSKSKGSAITVTATLSKKGKAGIIRATGKVTYVEGTSINKAFDITETDSYCVFVQNPNSSYLTCKGYYFK